MLTVLATALVLTLDPGGQAVLPRPSWAAPAEAKTTVKPLRSALWIPAGAYGMATTFAGGAGILTEYSTRRVQGSNITPPLIALAIGFLAGIVPGALLGQGAREDDNEKGRGAIGVLDVAGSAAVFFAFTQIFKDRT